MGKLPDLFFRQAGTANVNRRALRLFPFIYLILSMLPILLIVVSFFQRITMFKFALLAAILAFSVYTGIVRGKTLRSPFVKSKASSSTT